MIIKGGRNRNLGIKIDEESTEKEYLGRRYIHKRIVMECCGVKEEAKTAHIKQYAVLRFYDSKNILHRKFNARPGNIYIVINEQDFERIKEMIENAEKHNAAERGRIKMSVPLTFVVKTLNLRLLDMYYDAKVFVPRKWAGDMTEEERERYKRLIEAVKKFNNKKHHLDGYIDAREYEEGKTFTLSELEKIFGEELKKYDEYLREQKRKREERRREIERMRREALKKAKETGEEVIIRRVGGYDGDERYPERGWGWVDIYEVATPDGRIIEKEYPSY